MRTNIPVIARNSWSFLLLLFLACGGGGGGGGTPTAPPPPAPASRLLVNLIVVPVSAGGMEEASLSLDGREIVRQTCSALQPCQMTATLQGERRGAHTILLRVIRQSRQAVTYEILGQVDFTDTQGTRSVPLPQRRTTLRVNDTLGYDISI